jgi:hypothetical protein
VLSNGETLAGHQNIKTSKPRYCCAYKLQLIQIPFSLLLSCEDVSKNRYSIIAFISYFSHIYSNHFNMPLNGICYKSYIYTGIQLYLAYMIATATFDIRMSFLDNSGTKSHMAERVPEIEHCSSVYSKQYIN